jgi:hypothetical protein
VWKEGATHIPVDFFFICENPSCNLQMRSYTGVVAISKHLIMCLAFAKSITKKLACEENKRNPQRNRIIARCREAESYVRLCYARKNHAISKKLLESFAKTEHQKQKKRGFLCLDEESGETSNTGKGHTSVELASGTGVR